MLVGEADKAKTYKFDIEKICLYVPVIKITDSLQPHLSTLCENSPSRYFFQSCDLKLFNISKDISVYEVPRLYAGRLPVRLLICFYPATSVAGSNVHSPYFTSSTIGVRCVKLCHDGIVLHQISPDFAGKSYTLMYHNFVNFVCGTLAGSFMVTLKDFQRGHRSVLGLCLLILLID